MRLGGRVTNGCAWLLAGVLIVAGGCTAAPPKGSELRGSASASVKAPTAVPDAFAAAGIRAVRVVPDLGAKPGSTLELGDALAELVTAGSRLFTRRWQPTGERSLVASADLGRTWQAVDLPGATEADRVPLLKQAGPAVVVTKGDNRVWVTGDGVTWRGGPAPVGPDGYVLNHPAQHLGGSLVVGVTGKKKRGLVLTTDGGATWQSVDCPAISRPTGERDRCEAVTPAGGALWVRWYEVSVDSGRTWHTTSIVPDPGSSFSPMLRGLVALPTGGWLGPVVAALHPSPSSYLFVRSTDGLTWEPVVPYPCERAENRKSTVSRPQALGERWLVAYTCTDAADNPLRSILYLTDRDGTNPRVLATIDEPGHWYHTPVTIGGTTVVPEIRSDGHGLGAAVTFLHLQV
jgi:hypothetical protein